MRDDFCAFILTHGRPDKVHTYDTLLKAGYTGKVYIVIDDEDKTAEEYRKRYGDLVLQFCKKEVAERIDEGDNFQDRRAIIYARNACWDLAKKVGVKYFIQLDDDYTSFAIKHDSNHKYCNINITNSIDLVLDAMLEFYISTNSTSIALSQGGDHIGGYAYNGTPGGNAFPSMRRKAMNSFICSVYRKFEFFGKINEDVNTYTTLGRVGHLFFTIMQAKLNQVQTQSNNGGMTDIYLDNGTYIKTFYSVMYCPSAVKVGTIDGRSGKHYRLHHKINWNRVSPKIISEQHRKASQC